MSEADEVAESIFAGLSTPIESYADALRIAVDRLRGDTAVVQANVAESLWRLAQAKG